MNKKIVYTKIRNVKSPSKAYGFAAGSDFYVPEFDDKFLLDLKEKNKNNDLEYVFDKSNNQLNIIIPPGEQINIPSGICMNILDKNTYFQFINKSGIASKFHLDVMACVIDADYLGEVHINLSNNGNTPVEVKTGMKLIQGIHKEYIFTEWEEIDNKSFSEYSSERGVGGFGSSGI